jgi:hypothetical protein
MMDSESAELAANSKQLETCASNPVSHKPTASAVNTIQAVCVFLFLILVFLSISFILAPKTFRTNSDSIVSLTYGANNIKPHRPSPNSINDGIDVSTPWKVEMILPLKRVDTQETMGMVACWPSSGGIWFGWAPAVLLEYLGLSRFDDSERSSDPDEEDAFCSKLRTIGAQHFSLPPVPKDEQDYGCVYLDICAEPTKARNIFVAPFANGSAWVLDLNNPGRSDGTTPLIQNAYTMEERALLLKRMGGKFCETMMACPETAELVD